jgi:hypothetical protein
MVLNLSVIIALGSWRILLSRPMGMDCMGHNLLRLLL